MTSVLEPDRDRARADACDACCGAAWRPSSADRRGRRSRRLRRESGRGASVTARIVREGALDREERCRRRGDSAYTSCNECCCRACLALVTLITIRASNSAATPARPSPASACCSARPEAAIRIPLARPSARVRRCRRMHRVLHGRRRCAPCSLGSAPVAGRVLAARLPRLVGDARALAQPARAARACGTRSSCATSPPSPTDLRGTGQIGRRLAPIPSPGSPCAKRTTAASRQRSCSASC